MKVVLVNPPSRSLLGHFTGISLPDIPLNLAYIAGALESAGHVVRIVDMNVVGSKEELLGRLEEMRFDVVGLTSTTPLLSSCFRTARVLHALMPWATFVLGGWHASALPIKTLEECQVLDYVIFGEGEETMVELLSFLENGGDVRSIAGLAYRDENGKPAKNAPRELIRDIDSLPFPARHLLDLDGYRKIGFYTVGGYFKKDLYIGNLITSRGCAHACTFCADGVIYQQKCRLRSPESVVEEIKHMVSRFGIRIIFIIDANFTLNKERVRRICQLIIDEGIRVMWGCAARADCVTEDLLRLMKRAGCVRISYGIESGSPRVLNLMNKRITIDQARRAVRLTKKVGIPVYVYFVYGMPGETLQDARLSGQLLMDLKPNFVTHSIATPFPGSALFEQAVVKGLLKGTSWEDFHYPFKYVLENPEYKEILRYQAGVLRKFYLSPFFAWDTLKNLKSIYHLGFYLRALKSLVIYALTIR